MERTIDDFLNDIAEAKEGFDATPGFVLSKEDAEKMAERLAKIIEFENKISDLDGLKSVIHDVQRYKEKSPVELIDDPEFEDDQVKFEVPTSLQKAIKEVEKLLNKPKDEITDSEMKKIQDVADKLADEFKKFNIEVSSEYKETGVNTFKIKFEQSFPVKLTVGSDFYYGLVRPPTGMITWQGPTARAKAKEIGVPVKMPIMNVGSYAKPDFKVKRGADAFGEFMSRFQGENDNIDFDFDDSPAAKKRVIQALEDAGVSFKTDNFVKRGALKGVEDVINKIKLDDMIEEELKPEEQDLIINEGLTKNVKFWKNIGQIL